MKSCRISLVFVIAASLLLLPACTGKPAAEKPAAPPASKPASDTAEPSTETTSVSLYFVRGEKLGPVARVVDVTEGRPVAEAALAALLKGPSAEDAGFDFGTTIPEGTALNKLTVTGGTAIADMSRTFESGGGSLSMTLRVAQVVYTLTQFPGIERVEFVLDGESVAAIGGEGVIVEPSRDRASCEGEVPAILVESPLPGQSVESPVTVRGSANTFEAMFRITITDPEGLILVEKSAQASSGTGTRGTFSVEVPFTTARSGLGAVICAELSPKDGKPTNVVEIPVIMAP